MTEQIEQHGCIVCGKTYTLKVTYNSDGTVMECGVTSPLGAHRVFDSHRPIIACDIHSAAEIEAAYAKRYPGHQEDDEDGEDEVVRRKR